VSNEKKEIKVTDKRMFTAEGRLKEEYRFLDEKSTSAEAPEPAPAPASPQPAAPPASSLSPDAWADREPAPRAMPPQQDRWSLEPEPAAGQEFAEGPVEIGGPSFYDLVAMLAEPVPIYLGDARLPDGQSATNLELARLYIDMLEILRQKTAGNLDAQERAFLEDLLYRLRVRYVQKMG
jgi:hypothetical protein